MIFSVLFKIQFSAVVKLIFDDFLCKKVISSVLKTLKYILCSCDVDICLLELKLSEPFCIVS